MVTAVGICPAADAFYIRVSKFGFLRATAAAIHPIGWLDIKIKKNPSQILPPSGGWLHPRRQYLENKKKWIDGRRGVLNLEMSIAPKLSITMMTTWLIDFQLILSSVKTLGATAVWDGEGQSAGLHLTRILPKGPGAGTSTVCFLCPKCTREKWATHYWEGISKSFVSRPCTAGSKKKKGFSHSLSIGFSQCRRLISHSPRLLEDEGFF